MRKLLCKLGLHGYRLIGSNLMLTDSLEVCDTCGRGRILIAFGQGVQYLSARQVRLLLILADAHTDGGQGPGMPSPEERNT